MDLAMNRLSEAARADTRWTAQATDQPRRDGLIPIRKARTRSHGRGHWFETSSAHDGEAGQWARVTREHGPLNRLGRGEAAKSVLGRLTFWVVRLQHEVAGPSWRPSPSGSLSGS